MAAPSRNLPTSICVIRPPISIRWRWGIWKAVALSKSAAAEVESFDLFILRMLSASLIFTTLFFPPLVRFPVSSISWWRAECGVPQALSAGWNSSPPSPVQLQREGEDIFIVLWTGHFHGSCTVAQLFLHSGPAGEEQASWDRWSPPTPSPPPPTTRHQQRPISTNQPSHQARLEHRKQPSLQF